MKKRQTIEGWLKEALTDPEKEHPCSVVTLVHKINGLDDEIYSIKLTSGRAWVAEDLAGVFQHKADEISQDLIGVQSFQLLAFYGSAESRAKFNFVVTGRLDFGTDGFTTEQPNETGKTQQTMRLMEALVQGSFRERVYNAEVQGKIIDQQGSMLGKAFLTIEKLMETTQILALEKSTNNHAFQLAQLKVERENTMIEGAVKLAPAIINRLTGKEVFPKAAEDSMLLDRLAESISPETAEKLFGELSDDLKALLGQRVLDVLSKKEGKIVNVQATTQE